MIEWSGQNWYSHLYGYSTPSIQVIERPSASYEEYADRREREKNAKRVPFGFAIPEPEEADEGRPA